MTVVVPVYGDVDSLMECAQSLVDTVDQSTDTVLFVNDCGPEADLIEQELLRFIRDQPAFRYERNARNLGFVGNCNRAVLELDQTNNDILLLNSDSLVTDGFIDEMSAVLHASDRHGVVCPRSNNATIASIPHRLSASRARTIERTSQVHSALERRLPRYSISPVAMGFCFLVRRELIREFGFFDEIFSPGYGEENDFCLRINRFGYSAVIAHRALVFHVGGRSFMDDRRASLRAAHGKILEERYPFYPSAVQRYVRFEIDPLDHFADVMVPADDVAHVLIDCAAGDVTPELRVLLATARQVPRDRAHFTLTVPESARSAFADEFRGVTVATYGQVGGIFDLALFSGSSLSIAQLQQMNAAALRWAAWIDGMGETRQWEFGVAHPVERLASRMGMMFADTVLVSGDGVLEDARAYFYPDDDAGKILAQDFRSADSAIEALIRLSTAPIDDERLRQRWNVVTSMATLEEESKVSTYSEMNSAPGSRNFVGVRESVGWMRRRGRKP